MELMSNSNGNPGGIASNMSYQPQLTASNGAAVQGVNPITISMDEGNILIMLSDESVRSEEGLALVTVSVDKEGRLAYISIEPEDKGLPHS